jgi:sulfur carrier protein
MEIRLNGAPRRIPPGHTLAGLISELDLAGRRIAVEINQEVVPRSRYGERVLEAGDRVEVISAVGGG